MPFELLALDLTWTTLAAVIAGMAAGAAIVNPLVTFLRRPRLTLAADSDNTWTRVEGSGEVYVRPLVSCSRLTRGAKGARVLVESYRPQGTGGDRAGQTLGGTPSLGWPSAQDGTDGSLTVHPGATRPIDLGALFQPGALVRFADEPPPAPDPWHLQLTLAAMLRLTDGRDVLAPGGWTITLLVVADDAKSRRYDVDVSWNGDASDPHAALASLSVRVRSA